jgi:hypothetical protein
MSQFPNLNQPDDGLDDSINSSQKYPPLDAELNVPSNKILQNEYENKLEEAFLKTNLYETKKSESKKQEDYLSSEYRTKVYQNITEKDLEFNKYLKNIYGSAKNYFEMNQNLLQNKVYDPSSDFQAEIEIITDETYYRSYFISQSETILELLNGVCTIEFFQTDGRIERIVGSLSREEVPQSQLSTRMYAFSGLRGSRVLVWNMFKQKWASFYMTNLKRFVRDDTSGLE